jgi:MFS family permease
VYSLLSYPAGALSDRIPRRYLMAIGLFVFAIAYGGLGLATSSLWVWVLFPIYGAYTACTDGVGKAWIVDLVPTEVRGRALGLYQGLGGAGSVVAGLWAGLAWGSGGRGPLLVSAVAALVLAVVVALGIGLGHQPDRSVA